MARRRGAGPGGFNVGGLVALLILIAIGAIVLYEVTGSLETTTDSYAENAVAQVESRGYTSFNLLTILAIVIVAALIISVVVGSIGGGVGR